MSRGLVFLLLVGGLAAMTASCAPPAPASDAAGADPAAFDGVYEGQSGPAGGFCDTPTETARLVVRGGMARFTRMSYGRSVRYKLQRVEQDGTLQVSSLTHKINGSFKGDKFSANGIQISGMPCNLHIVLTRKR